MKQFLNSNPGLKSRFGKTIHFPDYSPVDMQAIFAKFCVENEYQISSKAGEKVKILTLALHAQKGENFGNGRTVRNLFQACLEKHNLRMDKIDEPTKEDLSTLEAEDILDDVTGIE